MVFRDRDLIFLHPGKTGGTAVEQALLAHFGVPPLEPWGWHPEYVFGWDPRRRGFAQHDTLAQMVTHGYVDRRLAARAYKFAFVRHPLDRLVSVYHWNRSRNRGRNPLACQCPTFTHFVRAACHLRLPMWDLVSHVRPQVEYVRGAAFVGRFEALQADFGRLCAALGLPPLTLAPHNKTPDRPADWRAAYGPVTAAMAQRFYAADLKEFEYSSWTPC